MPRRASWSLEARALASPCSPTLGRRAARTMRAQQWRAMPYAFESSPKPCTLEASGRWARVPRGREILQAALRGVIERKYLEMFSASEPAAALFAGWFARLSAICGLPVRSSTRPGGPVVR